MLVLLVVMLSASFADITNERSLYSMNKTESFKFTDEEITSILVGGSNYNYYYYAKTDARTIVFGTDYLGEPYILNDSIYFRFDDGASHFLRSYYYNTSGVLDENYVNITDASSVPWQNLTASEITSFVAYKHTDFVDPSVSVTENADSLLYTFSPEDFDAVKVSYYLVDGAERIFHHAVDYDLSGVESAFYYSKSSDVYFEFGNYEIEFDFLELSEIEPGVTAVTDSFLVTKNINLVSDTVLEVDFDQPQALIDHYYTFTVDLSTTNFEYVYYRIYEWKSPEENGYTLIEDGRFSDVMKFGQGQSVNWVDKTPYRVEFYAIDENGDLPPVRIGNEGFPMSDFGLHPPNTDTFFKIYNTSDGIDIFTNTAYDQLFIYFYDKDGLDSKLKTYKLSIIPSYGVIALNDLGNYLSPGKEYKVVFRQINTLSWDTVYVDENFVWSPTNLVDDRYFDGVSEFDDVVVDGDIGDGVGVGDDLYGDYAEGYGDMSIVDSLSSVKDGIANLENFLNSLVPVINVLPGAFGEVFAFIMVMTVALFVISFIRK